MTVIFSAEKLRKVTKKILESFGTPEENAGIVADHLVESNLVGQDSHGIVRILRYAEYIKEGRLKVSAKPQLVKDGPTTAILDANLGFGQVAAQMGMNIAMNKARRNGLGAVGIINCNHIGRLGAYVHQAAKNNFGGIVMCNTTPARMAPYGGKGPVLGTNPIAIGIPTGEDMPFLMDFACSKVAEGKVRVKLHEKKPIPKGWILDKYGRPSRNPADLYDGGALLPLGDHKGYSLSLAIDIICGALVGAGCTSGSLTDGRNGVLMLAFDIQSFTPLHLFSQRLKEVLEVIRSTSPANGFEKVMIPGEPEFDSIKKRLKNGISVPNEIWEEIRKVGSSGNLDIDNG